MLIAHFSDVHAFTLDGARPWQFLSKRFAGGLNLIRKRRAAHPVRLFEALVDDVNRARPDHVVCTGDLVNLSLPGEYALARGIVDRLAAGPDGVTLVPGNHDDYVWGAHLAHAFETAMAPYLVGDGGQAGYPIVKVRGDVAFVGISTARPSPVPFADGRIGKAQLAAVEEALAKVSDKFRLVALHHPPVHNRNEILRGLRDRRALAGVLARVGADLVVHGHEHRDLRATLDGKDGKIDVIGVGSGTYEDPRPDRRARYNLYRVEKKKLVSVETRVHDKSSDKFVRWVTGQSMTTPA